MTIGNQPARTEQSPTAANWAFRALLLGALVLVAGCSVSHPSENLSGSAITRVELTEDGTFVALHQQAAPSLPTTGPPVLELDIETVGAFAIGRVVPPRVYRSDNGADWIASDIAPDSIDWESTLEACIERLCVEFTGVASDGVIRDRTNDQVIFTPIEEPPRCLDFQWNPLSRNECRALSHVGPFDIAVYEANKTMVVALGTEGVARFDDGEWKQVDVDTPRPSSWARRNMRDAALLWTLGPFAVLALLTFLFRDRRARI